MTQRRRNEVIMSESMRTEACVYTSLGFKPAPVHSLLSVGDLMDAIFTSVMLPNLLSVTQDQLQRFFFLLSCNILIMHVHLPVALKCTTAATACKQFLTTTHLPPYTPFKPEMAKTQRIFLPFHHFWTTEWRIMGFFFRTVNRNHGANERVQEVNVPFHLTFRTESIALHVHPSLLYCAHSCARPLFLFFQQNQIHPPVLHLC